MNGKNPLRPILNIREIREEQASREFLKRKRAVAEAKEKLEFRIAEAAAFEQALREKENAVVDEMIRNPHQMGNVQAFRSELENWRFRLAELHAMVEEEGSNVAKAEEVCAQARTVYQAKTKEKVKTSTFADQWNIQAAKEAEFKEEMELEDRLPRKAAEETMETERP